MNITEKGTGKNPESREKRSEIIKAARKCFFEKGYDATTIREIMRKVGAEVGLFYYYFENKADVFDYAIDEFFQNYRKGFEKILVQAKRDPFGAMQQFFSYLRQVTVSYRENYDDHMHKMVRWGVREKMLEIMTPYFRELIDIFVSVGAKIPTSVESTAVLLTHGVGGLILHQENDWVDQNEAELRKAVNLIMGLNPVDYELVNPVFAKSIDGSDIIALTEKYSYLLPGYKRDIFREKLQEKIQKQEVVVIRCEGRVIGFVEFSREEKRVGYIAVENFFQRKGVAGRMLMTAMAEFPVGTVLSALAHEENSPRSVIGMQKLYQRFGFQKQELVEFQGEMCQSLVVELRESLPDLRGRSSAWS